MISIPDTWRMSSLYDLVVLPTESIVDGPFGSDLKANEYQDHGVPIIRLQNIDRNKFINKNIKFISKSKAQELKRHNFISGDIAVTKLGNPLGKAAIIPIEFIEGIIVADIVRIRPDNKFINSRYLAYAINAPQISIVLAKHTKGSTRPRINLKHIRDLELPIAPLSEQNIIVDKLDRVLDKISVIETRINNVSNTLKELINNVHNTLFSGNTFQDSTSNNASILRIRDVATLVTKGSSPRWQGINYVDDENETLFITSENIGQSSLLLNKKKYVESKFNEKQKRSILKYNDVLTNIVGASIGRTTIWNKKLLANINQAVCIIRLDKKKMLPEFLAMYLNSPAGLKQLISGSVEVARANISLESINSITLPDFDINLQRKIVKKIKIFLMLQQQINNKCEILNEYIDKLCNGIFKTAFDGNLTSMWREKNIDLITGNNSVEFLLAKIAEANKIGTQNKLIEKKSSTKKEERIMNVEKKSISIVEVLKDSKKQISAQELFQKLGYPNDASTAELEKFFLDVRENLKAGIITKQRKQNEDFFMLSN